MKYLILTYTISDDLLLKQIDFDYNDTGLSDDTKTLLKISIATIKAILKNEESSAVQDLLNELNIPREK